MILNDRELQQVIEFISTEENAKQYAAQQDKYLFAKDLLEARDIRATEAVISKLEDAFDAVNNRLAIANIELQKRFIEYIRKMPQRNSAETNFKCEFAYNVAKVLYKNAWDRQTEFLCQFRDEEFTYTPKGFSTTNIE